MTKNNLQVFNMGFRLDCVNPRSPDIERCDWWALLPEGYIQSLGTQDNLYQGAITAYNEVNLEDAQKRANKYLDYRFGEGFSKTKQCGTLLQCSLYPEMDERTLRKKFGVSRDTERLPVDVLEREILSKRLLGWCEYQGVNKELYGVISLLERLKDLSEKECGKYGRYVMRYFMWRYFGESSTVAPLDKRLAVVLSRNKPLNALLERDYGVMFFKPRRQQDFTGFDVSWNSKKFVPFPCVKNEYGIGDPRIRNMALILLSNENIQETLQQAKNYYLKKYLARRKDTYKIDDVRQYVAMCRLGALIGGNDSLTSHEALEMFNETVGENERWTGELPGCDSSEYCRWLELLLPSSKQRDN